MGLEIGIILIYAGVIIGIFLLGKLMLWPLKTVLKLAINSIIGGFVIIGFNYIFLSLGLFIPLNIITAVTVGLFGIPGAILLILLFVI